MTPLVASEKDVAAALDGIEPERLVASVSAGFVEYSAGNAVVPPVSELSFEGPPGDVHIKSGYLRSDRYFVTKIASGFYDNPDRGLAVSQGLMLLFSKQTGELLCALFDGGLLTRVRTALAGAVVARHLAPTAVSRIGIVGSGTQARLQLRYLTLATDVRDVAVLARNEQHALRYAEDMAELGFAVQAASSAAEIGATCNLIVTTTPATAPLLDLPSLGEGLRRGLHVTAVGADTATKNEIDPAILSRADVLVADSRSQCRERGEIAHALQAGVVHEEDLVELGEIIAGTAAGRADDSQLTVADLTGVAVQDLQIAKIVYEALGDAD